jgi:hypothetical protein
MADDNSIFDKMIEMGMGMTIANQIPQMMNSVMPHQNQQQTSVPPPIAGNIMQVYAYINSQQVGPLNEQECISFIQKGLITKNTLMWKAGLPNWIAATQIPEIGKLLLLYNA